MADLMDHQDKKSTYRLRELRMQDISKAKLLSDAEPWNQTEEDWALLIKNPQNICMCAIEGDRIIGTATAIAYARDIAWIGMVLVEKSYRGRGISKMLLKSLFEQLKMFGSIKLDATPAGQLVYRGLGFKDEYLINRMTNLSAPDIPDAYEAGNTGIVQGKDIPEIIEYDRKVFGADRQQLINYLIETYPQKARVLKKNGHIIAFALGRDGARFHHIGPVMASSTEDAKLLINDALRELQGQPVVVDVPDDKKELIGWLNNLGFVKQRHFIRMYQNQNPYPGTPEKQYLICGPEFG